MGMCVLVSIGFCLMIVEALGGWHKKAVRSLKKLSQALTRATGVNKGEVKCLFDRLSILLQKDKSILILNQTQRSVNKV